MSDTTDQTPSRRRGRRRGSGTRGEMPLAEHLRELRTRIMVSMAGIFIGLIVVWIFYNPVFTFIREPFDRVVEEAAADGRNVELVLGGVADAFTLQLQLSALGGLLLASPLWLFQLWRFLMPGLERRERRWAYIFAITATPLFLAGAFLGWIVLPAGLDILLGFTPDGVDNLIQVSRYLSFLIRVVVVFGIGFLLPFILVMLNFAGVLTGEKILSWWRGLIVGIFLFAAIATPTGDPVNLMLLAAPMLVLVALAIGVSLLNDKRRRRKGLMGDELDYRAIGDDEISPL